ncbi:hypothetical protein [Pseudomonas sp. Pseusp97]|uniref:hypothetical protein n=1 Tax=Pseudomonas sp. Pseusp97 TaxID=3243065 RepID=UPI0039A5D629
MPPLFLLGRVLLWQIFITGHSFLAVRSRLFICSGGSNMRRLLFVLAFLFCGNSFAVDYNWRLAPAGSLVSGSSNTQYPSPTAACNAVPGLWIGGAWNATGVVISLTKNSDIKYSCIIQIKNSQGTLANSSAFSIDRYGDGCTAPATYDAVLAKCVIPSSLDYTFCNNKNADSANPEVWIGGECVEIWRQDNAKMCKYFAKNSSSISKLTVKFDSAVKGPINGQTVAYPNLGCEITVSSSTCTVNADGKGSVCVVDGTYTGNVGGGMQSPKEQDCHALGGCDTPNPAPKIENNTIPCKYTTGADGSQSCLSKQETKQSGSQSCGTVNGVYGCSWNSPTSKGIDISTGITSTTASDGTKTEVKTDVSKKTVCTDMNVCSVVTTTTTTTTKKDGTGTLISSSSTCSGNGCGTGSATNGTGTGGGSGGGNGTGSGQGEGGCVTAEECSDGSGLDKPGMDKVPSYKETMQAFENSVNQSPMLSVIGGISIPEGGAAPSFRSASIDALGGGQLSFDDVNQLKPELKNTMSPIAKFVWCVLAVVLVLLYG